MQLLALPHPNPLKGRGQDAVGHLILCASLRRRHAVDQQVYTGLLVALRCLHNNTKLA